jgi:hypothetical protein
LEIDGEQRAKITALACSKAPEGYGRWSLRLLADKVVELGYCEHLSHNEAGKILKKNELKPHLKRTWCIGELDAVFLSKMEMLLWLYALPYDGRFPVVCFDERPCFLIGEAVEPLSLQTGKVAKQHYSYEKNGSCALLCAIEPLTGKRLAHVYQQRTKKEYAMFMKELAVLYPAAEKIRVVQDNLWHPQCKLVLRAPAG